MTNLSHSQISNKQGKQKNNAFKECFNFLVLVALVYLCYIISGVYHQKILKHAYLNPKTGEKSYFQQAIVFTLFPQLFGTIFGKPIPWKNALICGIVCNFNMFTYNLAVVQASFPAVVMVKSCSLLSVIIVGVFCSRVKDKNLKLRSNKIIIGIVACLGIFVFNFFKQSQQSIVDKPISLFSSLLLIASLVGDGFLPDLQAQIKTQYKPSVMQMYLEINKYTFFVAFAYSLITLKIFYFLDFFITHDQILFDITSLAVLNSLGQIVIYKMVKLYKQHIPAFVIGIRKCLTVVINIIYFGHSINKQQLFAIIFVFISIMWQTYDNYLQKKQKQKQQILKKQKNKNKNKKINQIQISNLKYQTDNKQQNQSDNSEENIDTNQGTEQQSFVRINDKNQKQNY